MFMLGWGVLLHKPRVVLFNAPHISAIIHEDASQAHLMEAFP